MLKTSYFDTIGQFALHLLLVVAFTAWFIIDVEHEIDHLNPTINRFYSAYLGISGNYGDKSIALFTEKDFHKRLDQITHLYFSHGSKGDVFTMARFHYRQPEQLQFTLATDDGFSRNFSIFKESFDGIEKKFAENGFNFDALAAVNYTSASAFVPLWDKSQGKKGRCYLWDLHFVLTGVHSGQVDLTMTYAIHDCDSRFQSWWVIFAGFMAIASLSWEMYLLWQSSRLAATVSKCCSSLGSGSNLPPRQPLLDCWDDMSGSPSRPSSRPDAWVLMTIAMNAAQIFAVVYGAVHYHTNVYVRINLAAIATATTWLNLIRYLAVFPKFGLLYNTLAMGIPQVGCFLVGVIPIFFAYAVLGVGLWAFDVDWFQSLSLSSASLFSLFNGDTLMDTFHNLKDTNWFFAQLYLYSFLCLFIYVVMNVTISIVETAYIRESLSAYGLKGLGSPQGDTSITSAKRDAAQTSYFQEEVLKRLSEIAESHRTLAEQQQVITERLAKVECQLAGVPRQDK